MRRVNSFAGNYTPSPRWQCGFANFDSLIGNGKSADLPAMNKLYYGDKLTVLRGTVGRWVFVAFLEKEPNVRRADD
jgi:hypothetical protein